MATRREEPPCLPPLDIEAAALENAAPQTWSWSRLVALAGLPCLISVAAIDPGNLEVDLQAGNLLGYRLIFGLLFASIAGWLLQTLAAHVTILTGAHLAELCAHAYRHFPVLKASLFVVAEVSIIAFDVAEVVGTAFALQLLFGWPLWLGMLTSAFDTMLVLYLQKRGMSKLEMIIEGMLFLLAACLLFEFILSRPSLPAILKGALIPDFGDPPRVGVMLVVGILGSIAMSHNCFLHSWLVKERRRHEESSSHPHEIFSAFSPSIAVGSTDIARADIHAACNYATIEAGAVFVATFIINACVLSVAATLPHDPSVPIEDLGLKDASALLRNVLGTELASTAWALALLASGHAATVTGTLASQAVCEGFLKIREGESTDLLVLSTRAVAIIPAVCVALAAGEKGSDHLIVITQVVLSLTLPFAGIPLLKLLSCAANTHNRSHSPGLLKAGYIAFALVIAGNILVVGDTAKDVLTSFSWPNIVFLSLITAAALALTLVLVFLPVDLSDLGRTDDTDQSERLALLSESAEKATYSATIASRTISK